MLHVSVVWVFSRLITRSFIFILFIFYFLFFLFFGGGLSSNVFNICYRILISMPRFFSAFQTSFLFNSFVAGEVLLSACNSLFSRIPSYIFIDFMQPIMWIDGMRRMPLESQILIWTLNVIQCCDWWQSAISLVSIANSVQTIKLMIVIICIVCRVFKHKP